MFNRNCRANELSREDSLVLITSHWERAVSSLTPSAEPMETQTDM